MFKRNFFSALATIAAIGMPFMGVASAQTVGTIDIYNGDSTPINIGIGDATVTSPFSLTTSLPVTIDSGSTQNAVSISGPTKTNVTLSVNVRSSTNQSYGCNFQVVFIYQYTIANNNYYYPNNSATPFYPPGATTIPTCYAEPSGPTTAIDSFYEYFSIKGL